MLRHAAIAWVAAGIAATMMELPQRLARSALVHAQQRCLHRHGLRLEWPHSCLGWRCRAQLERTLSAVLAAIRRHAAVALAAARMVAAMLWLRCLAWLLQTIDGNAGSGAQAHCEGICCSSSGSSHVWGWWQQRCLDWRRSAQPLGTLKAVLAAVLWHAAMASTAAGVAATKFGLVLTRSAFVHTPGRCLQRCLATQRRHWPRLNGNSDAWAGVWRVQLLYTLKGGAGSGT